MNCFSHIAETEAVGFEHGLLENNICKLKISVQKSKSHLMSYLHMKSSAHYMRISNLSDISISCTKYVFLTTVHHNLLFSHPKWTLLLITSSLILYLVLCWGIKQHCMPASNSWPSFLPKVAQRLGKHLPRESKFHTNLAILFLMYLFIGNRSFNNLNVVLKQLNFENSN